METPELNREENVLLKIHQKVNLFFWASIIIIAYINVYKFPAVNIYGEMIGEMNDFFIDAKFESWWHNLTTMHTAYLPLLDRIFSMIIVTS